MQNRRAESRANAACSVYSAFCILTSAFRLLDDREHVVLAHDDDFFAVELDLGAGVAGEDDLVALLDGERGLLAVVEALAVADRQDLAPLGLLLGRVGEDDAALGLPLGLDTLDEDLVAEGTQLSHVYLLLNGDELNQNRLHAGASPRAGRLLLVTG